MPNPFIGIRISPALNEAIAERMKATDQSKSEIVIAALENYLGLSPCHDRLTAIEERLSVLETIMQGKKLSEKIK